MSNRLIPFCEVVERVCLSKTVIYRRINLNEFPKPVPIGRQRVAFIEAEIEAWIEARMQARDSDENAGARRMRALHAVKRSPKYLG